MLKNPINLVHMLPLEDSKNRRHKVTITFYSDDTFNIWLGDQPVFEHGPKSIEEHFDLKGDEMVPIPDLSDDQVFKSKVLEEIKNLDPLEAKYDDQYIGFLNRLTQEYADFEANKSKYMMKNNDYDEGPHFNILQDRLFPKSRTLTGVGIVAKQNKFAGVVIDNILIEVK